MNGMLRDMLTERANAAGSPDLHVHDLIAHGERRVRRRRRVALVGTAAAVALTVGATFALLQSGDRMASPVGPPTNPPSTREVTPDTTGRSRPLTYGLGATIHYGDRTIQAAGDADGLFVFDDGVAILTGDDGRPANNRLFFTEGSEQVEIARGIGMLTAGEVGSLLVWLDGDDVVIFDTHARGVVARVALNGMRLARPISPLEDAVYWTEYDDSTATKVSDGQLVRYDMSTGNRAPATQADYRAETRRTPPMLAVGSADSFAPADCCSVVDSRLQGHTPRGGAPAPVFVTATGERLRVSVPDRYEGETLSVFQWLDDDQFAIVMSAPGVGRVPSGDLLVCRVSSGQCRTVASGEQSWLLPGPGASLGAQD